MEYNKIEVKGILRKLRKEHKLNQTQFAEMVGLKRSTYAYYELGRTTPDISILVRIAKAYGITLDEMLGCFEKADKIAASDEENYSVTSVQLSLDEKNLLIHFRLMDDKNKKEFLEMAKNNCDFNITKK